MGGSDERENLVRLRPEEHFIAHQLLVFIYPKHTKLVYGLLAMSMSVDGNRVNNKMFGWMRRRVAKEIRRAKTGVPRPRAAIEKMRLAKTGVPQSPVGVEKRRLMLTGRVFSEDHKQSLTEAWQKRTNKAPMAGKQHSPENEGKAALSGPRAKAHTRNDREAHRVCRKADSRAAQRTCAQGLGNQAGKTERRDHRWQTRKRRQSRRQKLTPQPPQRTTAS
jgi:hypothetical protein